MAWTSALSKDALSALRKERSVLAKQVKELERDLRSAASALSNLDRILENGREVVAPRPVKTTKVTRKKKSSQLPRGYAMLWCIYVLGNMKTEMTLAGMLKHAKHKLPMAYRKDESLTDDKLMSRLSAQLFQASQKGHVHINRSGRPFMFSLTKSGRKKYTEAKKFFDSPFDAQ